MSDILIALLLIALGPGFLAYGIWILRSGAWRESVPLAELVLDRTFGIEPPPRNKWDRRIALAQAWFMTLTGAFVTLGLGAVLIIDFVSE